MPKGYWVVRANVNNLEEYSKYIEIASGIIKINRVNFY
jgi:hypothetical protein